MATCNRSALLSISWLCPSTEEIKLSTVVDFQRMATPKRIDASLHIGERLPLEAAANTSPQGWKSARPSPKKRSMATAMDFASDTSNLTTKSKRRHSVHQFWLVGGSEQQVAVRPLINFLKQDSNESVLKYSTRRLPPPGRWP